MCIIIHKPEDQTIDRDIIDAALDYNPDGFGYMYNGTAHKQLNISTNNVMAIIARLKNENVVFHFRLRTAGNRNKANCHPFKLAGKHWAMHNGTMPEFDTHKTKSDSRVFFDTFLGPKMLAGKRPSKKKIENRIGRSNKIVTMDQNGKFTFYNRATGYDHAGLWFSNTYAWNCPSKHNWWNSYDRYGPEDYEILEPVCDGSVMRDKLESRLCDAVYSGEVTDLIEPYDGTECDWELLTQLQENEIDIYTYSRCISDAALLGITDCLPSKFAEHGDIQLLGNR